jgi:hypothetical protein
MQDAKTFAIQIFMGCVPNDTRFQLGKAERMIKERDADGIAQGRREAADIFAWLLGYTDFRQREPGEGAYWWRKELRQRMDAAGIILGTASAEKTDKHATFPPHDNDGQTA